PMARASRGDVLRSLRRPKEAIADLTAAIRLGCRTVEVYTSRAAAYLAVDDDARALDDAQLALDQEPGNAWAQAVRGLARARLSGRVTADARADVESAESLDPAMGWA